jgi:hypothetical protein
MKKKKMQKKQKNLNPVPNHGNLRHPSFSTSLHDFIEL